MFRFWIIVAITIMADLGSKEYIFKWLLNTPTQGVEIINNWVALNLHINRGAVWGLGGGNPVLLIAITAVIIPIVIYLAYSSQRTSKPFTPLLGFGMLLGGALGNLYDRVFIDIQLRGYQHSYRGVRDFIDVQIPDVYSWPVFNVADIAIVIGVAIFVLWSLFESSKKYKR